MALTNKQVAELYVVLYNRAAEGSGLKYWVDQGGDTLQTVSKMLGLDVVKTYFGETLNSNEAFVTKIYQNVLNKEPEADALKYWADIANTQGKAAFVAHFVNAIPANKEKDPTAAAIFENKVAISEYMAEKVASVPKDGENYDFQNFQDALKDVTADNLAEKKAFIDGIADEPTTESEDNSNVIKLQYSQEPQVIEGTKGKDTFDAVFYMGNGTEKSTLTALDKIQGNGDDDTLNLVVLANNFANGGTADAPKLSLEALPLVGVKDVANLNITTDLEAADANLTINGYDSLSYKTSAKFTESSHKLATDAKTATLEVGGGEAKLEADEATTVTLVGNANSSLTASKVEKLNVDLNDIAHEIDVSALTTLKEATLANLKSKTAATGLANLKTLSLDNVDYASAAFTTAKLEKLTIKDTAKVTDGIVATGVEKLDLTLDGKSAGVDVKDANLVALNVHANAKAGEIANNTNNVAVETVTIDGSGEALSADFTAAVAIKSVDATKFSGDLTLNVKDVANAQVKLGSGNDRVKVDAVEHAMTIDGGEGDDALSVTSTVAVGVTTNELKLTNIEALAISDALTGNLDMSKWAPFTKVILEKKSATDATIINLANNSDVVIEKTALDQNLTLSAKDDQSVLNVTIDPKDAVAGLDLSGHNIVTTKVATLNLTSSTNAEKLQTLQNQVKVKGDDALSMVTLKGDAAMTTLKFDTTTKTLNKIDASAYAGAATIDATAHMANDGVIIGGKGDDTIKFGGQVSATGGEGNDTFDVALLTTSSKSFGASQVATITDFAKGDMVKLGSLLTDGKKLVKYELEKTLDFYNNAVKAEAAASTAESRGAYFVFEGNTYVVASDGTEGVANTDGIVKLAGVVDLSEATIASHVLTLA